MTPPVPLRFYERGLARMAGRWVGQGQTGDAHLPATHLYARDLDVFGRAGLFELLSTARTAEGEEVLARWLLHAAPPDEVRARQEAVRELASLIDVRELAAIQGEVVRKQCTCRAFAPGPRRRSFCVTVASESGSARAGAA